MVIGSFGGLLDLLPAPGALLAQAPWASPPQLPAPPEIQRWLFERPLTAGAVLLVFALVAMVGGRFQGRPRAGMLVGLGFLAAGALIAILSVAITTDRERILDRSRAVMDAIRAGDTAAAPAYFADTVTAVVAGGSAGLDREWVTDVVALFPDQLVIESAKVQERRAAIDGDGLGRTQVFVRGGPKGASANLTWWQFSWRRSPEGDWRIHSMDLLLLNGKAPDSAMVDLIQKASP